MNNPVEIMPKTLFNKIIKEIVDNKIPHTMIYLYLQNEPFMDRDVLNKIRVIKELSKNKIRIGLVTNGTFLDSENINELRHLNIDLFTVSLDAYTKETYDKIRSGLDFSAISSNIDNLINQGYKGNLYIGFVKQKDNISELLEFKKYWKRKKISTDIFQINNRSGDLSDFNSLDINKDKVNTKRIRYRFIPHLTLQCDNPYTNFNILSNGNVILCCNDYHKKIILGNVASSSIKDIWNSSQYNEIRRLMSAQRYHLITVCKNCSIVSNNT